MGYARVQVSVRFLRLGRLQMDELLAHYKHAQAFPSRRAPGEIGVLRFYLANAKRSVRPKG